MPVFFAFVAYLLGALLLATLLLPALYPGIAALLGDQAEPSGTLYRLAMLMMLLGLPWFLRRLGLLDRRSLGYPLPAHAAWTAVLKGLGVGIVMLTLLAIGLLLFESRVLEPGDTPGMGRILEVALVTLIGGLLIGLIEETFFRGMLFSGMRRSLPFWPTALLTGVFYAAVHFIRPAELPAGVELDVAASLEMFGRGLANLGNPASIHDSLAGLFVAGVFLAMVRERTGNILWAIGIHAGWVLVVRFTKLLTESNGHSPWIGEYDNFTGWLAAIWIALIAAAYWHQTRPRPQRPPDDRTPGRDEALAAD